MSRRSSVRCVAIDRFRALGSSEDGAALVMTLAVFFLMYVAILSVYTVATAVRERIHLQNAVDAAAYSAAVVQADTFSRVAAINRAMAWTYVQMSRRQMDYAVLKWLPPSYAHYKKDKEHAEDHSGCTGWCVGAMQIGLEDPVNLGKVRHSRKSAQHEIQGNIVCLDKTILLNGMRMSPLGIPYETAKLAAQAGEFETIANLAVSGDFAYALTGSILALRPQLAMIRLYADLNSASDKSTLASLDALQADFDRFDEEFTDKAGDSRDADVNAELDVTLALKCLKAQIFCDRFNIAGMNICSRRLVRLMPSKIKACVEDVLKANVPEQMLPQCRWFLAQNEDPLKDEQEDSVDSVGDGTSGYFRNLYNCKQDEKHFVRFADFNDPLVKVFGGTDSVLLGGAGGFNQWFVRGNGEKRTTGAIGLQRSYKHWAENSGHMAHNPSGPSCYNSTELEGVPPTYALHSQWEWFARDWYCAYFPPTPWTGEFSIHVPIPLWPECPWDGNPGLDLAAVGSGLVDFATSLPEIMDYVSGTLDGVDFEKDDDPGVSEEMARRRKGVNFDVDPNPTGSSSPADDYDWGCCVTMSGVVINIIDGFPVPIPLFRAYSRTYGDDKHLFNQAYIGERAKPLIFRENYFGGDGTITVGLARENENVWRRILGVVEGIFTAFDPAMKWSWAFASAKAGYKYKTATEEGRAYRVDWRDDQQDWNLCQSDWDAVFVPVRQAQSLAKDGAWNDGSKGVLADWIGGNWRKFGAWFPLPMLDLDWYLVGVPPGMGNGVFNMLDWGRLTDVMYH